MLDVHAPHHPANGVRDFFLHLFTITIGLLIAVGIEGLVERHQHRETAEAARQNLRAEIKSNADSLDDALKTIKKEETIIDADLTEIRHMQQTKDQHGSLDGTYRTITLRRTAWKTAQQTGALAYMPYDEAQRFSDIYDAQELFLDQEGKLMDDSAHFFGIVRRANPDTKDFESKDFADLGELFGIWQIHLLNLDILAQDALEHDKAYLEGREPRGSFNATMHG